MATESGLIRRWELHGERERNPAKLIGRHFLQHSSPLQAPKMYAMQRKQSPKADQAKCQVTKQCCIQDGTPVKQAADKQMSSGGENMVHNFECHFLNTAFPVCCSVLFLFMIGIFSRFLLTTSFIQEHEEPIGPFDNMYHIWPDAKYNVNHK